MSVVHASVRRLGEPGSGARGSSSSVPKPAAAVVAPEATKRFRALPWAIAMIAIVLVVGALARWDGERESAVSLEDFADDQAGLAGAIAAELGTRLGDVRHDARLLVEGDSDAADRRAFATPYLATRVSRGGSSPSASNRATVRVPVGDRTVEVDVAPRSLVELASRGEQPGRRLLLLFAPTSADDAFTMDGRTVVVPSIADAFHGGRATVRLGRQEAAALGLPARTAMAGVAAADAGDLGRWGVAVVSTAASERDREIHASSRLVLAVLLAGGTVLAFGAFALRRQRKELDLERELALAQLQRRRDDRLVRASRAATMGTLAMGIAHEISTPLAVIAGRTEQLLARADDEREKKGLRAIADQVAQIGEVVRGFLDLARGGRPSVTSVAPAAIVDGAVRLVEHRFATANVAFVADLAADLPSIHCDVRLVEHALVNLLLNACQACEDGGRVDLAVRAEDGTISFVVTDDGVGITEEDAARATEPFFTTKAGSDGTGLGLAIAQEIAKSHRGSLAIAPHAPQGTRATFRLPIELEDGAHA